MSSISRVIVQGLGEQVSYLKVEGRIGLASGDKWKKKKVQTVSKENRL